MHLEILVEEISTEVTLHNLLPKLVTGEHTYRIISFQGKNDLLNKLDGKLRAYKRWIPDNYRIIVLVDRDSEDCYKLKKELENSAQKAHLPTKSNPDKNKNFIIVNRIVVEELESWFFGDHEAIRNAYPKVSRNFQYKSTYRNPDSICGGTWEALERILKAAKYFGTGYRKVEAAKSISFYMEPLKNRSQSFKVFWDAITEIIE